MKNRNLKPLCTSKIDQYLPSILTQVCGYSESSIVPNPPPIEDRVNILKLFEPARVVKKGQVGKPKQVTGFVWLDTDPLAILLNKFQIRSCHTLDNTHEYQAGNINHMYNPYLGTLFGHKDDVEDIQIYATSPIKPNYMYGFGRDGQIVQTSNGTLVDGVEYWKIRPHQVAANVFYTHDEQGKQYMVLGRIFDSCGAEYPWAYTFYRYMRTRCSRLGIGFALGVSYKNSLSKSREEIFRLPGSLCDTAYLYMGPFQLPKLTTTYSSTRLALCYGDDDLSYYQYDDGRCGRSSFAARVCALIILEPVGPPVMPIDTNRLREVGSMAPDNIVCCYECEKRFNANSKGVWDGDNFYCFNCYNGLTEEND